MGFRPLDRAPANRPPQRQFSFGCPSRAVLAWDSSPASTKLDDEQAPVKLHPLAISAGGPMRWCRWTEASRPPWASTGRWRGRVGGSGPGLRRRSVPRWPLGRRWLGRRGPGLPCSRSAHGIARSRVPVLTALGHATDHTVADLVAHGSYETPSAAAGVVVARAEMVVGQQRAIAAHQQRLATPSTRPTLTGRPTRGSWPGPGEQHGLPLSPSPPSSSSSSSHLAARRAPTISCL